MKQSAQSGGKKKSAVVSFIPFVIIHSFDDLIWWFVWILSAFKDKADKTVIWRVFKKNINILANTESWEANITGAEIVSCCCCLPPGRKKDKVWEKLKSKKQ